MAAAVPSIEKAASGVTSSAVLGFLRKPKQLLIGGKWVPAKSGKTFETINPANEEVLALAAEGDKADVDEAVKAARKASKRASVEDWPSSAACASLKIADLQQNADELATLKR
jgi:phenylacetaldehyde dehydrogenase